jgi:hypothetical protein
LAQWLCYLDFWGWTHMVIGFMTCLKQEIELM